MSSKARSDGSLLQGCMNNLTFGDANMGYYETIAGGAGAGPGWHGHSGVHTHMTNTRITDPGQNFLSTTEALKMRSTSSSGNIKVMVS